MRFKIILPILLNLLTGCASTAIFDASEVVHSLTPQSVIADPELNIGQTVLWGGIILDIHNLKDSTQIEVLAYPLSSSQYPQLRKKPLGRFIIVHQSFLEPATFAQGRQLTVLGNVGETKSGKVGESVYIYPVINARQLELWSGQSGRSRTNFLLGIGITL